MNMLSVRCNIVLRAFRKHIKGVCFVTSLINLCLPYRKPVTAGTSSDICQAYGQTKKLCACVKYEIIYQLNVIEYLFVFFQLSLS